MTPLAADVANELGNASSFAFGMFWEILWALIFLAIAAVLVWRFVRTGGVPMLRLMNRPLERPAHEAQAHAHAH
jgi:hypothetical protein